MRGATEGPTARLHPGPASSRRHRRPDRPVPAREQPSTMRGATEGRRKGRRRQTGASAVWLPSPWSGSVVGGGSDVGGAVVVGGGSDVGAVVGAGGSEVGGIVGCALGRGGGGGGGARRVADGCSTGVDRGSVVGAGW